MSETPPAEPQAAPAEAPEVEATDAGDTSQFQQLPSQINYQVPGSPYSAAAVAAGFSRETLLAVQAASGRGAVDYLFDKSQVPPAGQDTTSQTLGTQFQVSQSGLSLLAISFYWNVDSSQGPIELGVYDRAGTLLVRSSASPPASWGWVFTALAEPVPLDPDTPYWVVYQSKTHAFPIYQNYTFPQQSSPTGLATIVGGGSAPGETLQMPAADGHCYFVDANIG